MTETTGSIDLRVRTSPHDTEMGFKLLPSVRRQDTDLIYKRVLMETPDPAPLEEKPMNLTNPIYTVSTSLPVQRLPTDDAQKISTSSFQDPVPHRENFPSPSQLKSRRPDINRHDTDPAKAIKALTLKNVQKMDSSTVNPEFSSHLDPEALDHNFSLQRLATDPVIPLEEDACQVLVKEQETFSNETERNRELRNPVREGSNSSIDGGRIPSNLPSRGSSSALLESPEAGHGPEVHSKFNLNYTGALLQRLETDPKDDLAESLRASRLPDKGERSMQQPTASMSSSNLPHKESSLRNIISRHDTDPMQDSGESNPTEEFLGAVSHSLTSLEQEAYLGKFTRQLGLRTSRPTSPSNRSMPSTPTSPARARLNARYNNNSPSDSEVSIRIPKNIFDPNPIMQGKSDSIRSERSRRSTPVTPTSPTFHEPSHTYGTLNDFTTYITQDEMRQHIATQLKGSLENLVRLQHQDSIQVPASSNSEIRNVLDWSLDDVSDWLRSIELETYVSMFQSEEVDGLALLEITEADLKDLGFSLGKRKRFMRNLRHLRQQNEQNQIATYVALNSDDSRMFFKGLWSFELG